MHEGISHCDPFLLEPIASVEISVPTDFTSNVLRLIGSRRGQILAHTGKAGWSGWDVISSLMPVAEMQTLVLELRSQTLGTGFFRWEYAHLAPAPQRVTSQLLATTSAV